MSGEETAPWRKATEPVIDSEAHRQGAVNVIAWVSSDDLGGAIVMFTVISTVSLLIFLLAHALSRAARPRPYPAAPSLTPEAPAAP